MYHRSSDGLRLRVAWIFFRFLLLGGLVVPVGGQSVDDLLDNVPSAYREPNPWTWKKPFLFERYAILEPYGDIRFDSTSAFRLAVLQGIKSDSIVIKINKLSRLQYIGPLEIKAHAERDDTLFFMLPVVVPVNDTCGMEVVIRGADTLMTTAACYLVTSPTMCQVWWSDPRTTPKRFRGPAIKLRPPNNESDTGTLREIRR